MVGVGGAAGWSARTCGSRRRRSRRRRCRRGCRGSCVLVLGAAGARRVVGGVAGAAATARARRRSGGGWCGRRCRPPSAVDHCWRVMWDLVRGAAQLKQPTPAELGRRYTELLGRESRPAGIPRAADHRARSRRAPRSRVRAGRRGAAPRSDPAADDARRPTRGAPRCSIWPASARDHLADAVAAALTVPVATERARDHASRRTRYWRGETHRLCDRPGEPRRGCSTS